jgi:hypothetical protein
MLCQGCLNTRCQVTWATKFCVVVPNFFGHQYRKLLHVTYLAPTLLENFCAFVLYYGLVLIPQLEYLYLFDIIFVNDDLHAYE